MYKLILQLGVLFLCTNQKYKLRGLLLCTNRISTRNFGFKYKWKPPTTKLKIYVFLRNLIECNKHTPHIYISYIVNQHFVIRFTATAKNISKTLCYGNARSWIFLNLIATLSIGNWTILIYFSVFLTINSMWDFCCFFFLHFVFYLNNNNNKISNLWQFPELHVFVFFFCVFVNFSTWEQDLYVYLCAHSKHMP